MFNLLPRDETFFDMLEELSAHVVAGVGQLKKLAGNPTKGPEQAGRIREEEQAADQLAQSALERLDKAFITPIDREDILDLIEHLYDVVETVAGLAERFSLYHIEKLDPEFVQQIDTLQESTDCLNDVFKRLRDGHELSKLKDQFQTLHELERTADGRRRDFIGKLYADATDPLDVMKRRDLHDLVERAIDNCEYVSRSLQRVVLKNG